MTETPRTIELVLDIPTCIVFTANNALNHRVKANRVNALRGLASHHATQHLKKNPNFKPFKHYTVHFEVLGHNRGTHLDPNNYAPTLKALIDGATGRWWEDDDATHLVHYSCSYGGYYKSPKEDPIKYRRFHITITEYEPGQPITQNINPILKPIERPDLEDKAKEWSFNPEEDHDPIPLTEEDKKYDPNNGLKMYKKLVATELRKKTTPKPEAAAALAPSGIEEKPLIEFCPPQDGEEPQEPANLDW